MVGNPGFRLGARQRLIKWNFSLILWHERQRDQLPTKPVELSIEKIPYLRLVVMANQPPRTYKIQRRRDLPTRCEPTPGSVNRSSRDAKTSSVALSGSSVILQTGQLLGST
jgi:hypothetical protein